LTGEIQGQFELDFAAGQVWPAAQLLKDPLAQKYAGKRIPDFLSELHRAVDGN
jgi:hypothetical protein